MRADDREFVLKKRDPNQWTSGLLQCNSANSMSTTVRSSSITRPHSSLVLLFLSRKLLIDNSEYMHAGYMTVTRMNEYCGAE